MKYFKMKDQIIKNLFEFTEFLGRYGECLYENKGYKYTAPEANSWPSRVFELDGELVHLPDLFQRMQAGQLPRYISMNEEPELEQRLIKQGFVLQSAVKGMYMNLTNQKLPKGALNEIERVENKQGKEIFAQIVSQSFGYEIHDKTIEAIPLDSSRLKIYIAKYNGEYVSCGMVFLDSQEHAGLHMIGSVPDYRGVGLGTAMTQRLLVEAINMSETAVLVASQAGARIYSKLGFKESGVLKSYSAA